MPSRLKPCERLIPYKGTLREYNKFLESLVVDLKRRNTKLEADRERIAYLVTWSTHPSHQVPVDSGSEFDSVDQYLAASSSDFLALKRPRSDSDLSGTQLLSNQSFSTIITTPQACPPQNIRATGVSFTWNTSEVDENVQDTRVERPRKRPRHSRAPAKPDLLESLPISEQQWIDLRNTSNFNTSEILFNNYRALVLDNKGLSASLSNVTEEGRTSQSICQKLLKTHQELQHATIDPLLSHYRELLFCCICAISIHEGSTSDEVDLLMRAYWPGLRHHHFTFWSRFRDTAKRMARLIESTEGAKGYRVSQFLLMKSFTMEQYHLHAVHASISDITKEMKNLEGIRAEAEEYRLSYSPAVLLASMGIKLETVNEVLGTTLTEQKFISQCQSLEARLKAFAEPNQRAEGFVPGINHRDPQTQVKSYGHSTERPANNTLTQTSTRGSSGEIQQVVLPSVSNILQTAHIQPNESEISTIDIGDQQVLLRSLLHTKDRRNVAEMAINKERLTVRKWAQTNGFDDPWYSAQSLRLKAGSLWTPPSMVVSYIALSASSNVCTHVGRVPPIMKDGKINMKLVKRLSWYPKALHTFNSSHSIMSLGGDIDFIFIKVINGPSKAATT